jgi:hypothetical protein
MVCVRVVWEFNIAYPIKICIFELSKEAKK